MQITELSSDGLKRQFKIVVPANDIDAQMHSRLTELGQTVAMPGFRPGKIPIGLLKKRFGQSVLGEVLQRAVAQSSERAISDRGLRPAMQPKVEVKSFAEGKDLEYELALEILPEIKPADLDKIELERWTSQVDDAAVDKGLARLAEQARQAEPIAEPRGAERGDVVVVDFLGTIDGKPFDGGAAEGVAIEVGAGRFIPGFEDQIVGAKAGEQRTVNVTFPTDYPAADVAGKPAGFAVTVKELKRLVTPAIDDALAKTFGQDSLAALRKVVREQIEREYRNVARVRLKRALLDKLAELHHFDIPGGLADAEFDQIWRQVETDRKAGRIDRAEAGKTEDTLKAEYRAIAERRVRLGLLLAEVGRLNNISVTRDDLNRALVEEARRHPGQERAVVDYYQKNPETLAALRGPILEDKVVDFMLELAKVREREVAPDMLLAPIDGEPVPAA